MNHDVIQIYLQTSYQIYNPLCIANDLYYSKISLFNQLILNSNTENTTVHILCKRENTNYKYY